MKTNTARARTQASRTRIQNQHLHCQMAVRQKGPHWGLYCAEHGTWICWIPQSQLAEVL
jgi:hypothetical protein